MIIRTHVRPAERQPKSARRLSQRELQRLAHTKHPAGKIPIKEENLEEEIIEEKKEVSAVASETTVEPNDEMIAQPGTAIIKSKALEDLERGYKMEPKIPKKKYKIISLKEQ